MYILSKLWLVGISLSCLGFGSLPAIKLLAVPPTPDLTVTPTIGSSVASVRSNPPAPGTTVEVEAYFNGVMSMPHSIPPTVYREARCPLFVYEAALTDQPVLGQLSILNSVRNNVLPDKAPWLIAGVLKPNKAGVVLEPSLPYHARLRGHLGDPAVAKCPRADRIFIVEQVVKVYSQQPPDPSFFQMKRPSNFATWPRYHNATLDYSIAYPPDWKVERKSLTNDSSDLVLRFPQLPNYPVVVRVYPNALRYSHYLSRPEPSTVTGSISQTWIMGGNGSQHLSGFTVERDPGVDTRTQSVLFSTRSRIYELKLQYPLGFKASQPLLTNYSAIVLGFRLDKPKQNIPFSPYPTPTPTASPREPKRK